MMNSDDFAEAVNKSMAEVRVAMQETAERLEAEFRRLAGAAGVDNIPAAERMRDGNEQLRELLDSLRDETVRAAGQFSDGMNEMMAELRRLLEATMPGWASGAETDSAAKASAGAVAASSTAKKSAKKSTKKAAAKKSTKKAAAKKSAKKSTKKAAAKKSTKKVAKKSAKKAAAKKTAKKSTKKAAAKKSAKKSTKKAAAKKSTKKAAKKAR